MYFKGELAAIHLSGAVFYSGGHFQWSSIFKCNVFFFETSTCSLPFFKGSEFFLNSICSHSFDKLPSFYYKSSHIIVATYSTKFTAHLQNRNCSKEI